MDALVTPIRSVTSGQKTGGFAMGVTTIVTAVTSSCPCCL